jgi:hypothetical protein
MSVAVGQTTSVAMSEARLRRLQWAVRLTLALGVAASITANILHARPNPISQAIAAWPPVALLITVELVSRIPIYRRWLGVVRVVATFAIAGIAAWVSSHHMAAVVARYGETGTVPYLLPLSVDGLIVVASVSLVELAGRRRDTAPGHASPGTHTTPAQTPATPTGTLTEPTSAVPTTAVPTEPIPDPDRPVPAIVGGAAPEPEPEPEPVPDPVGERVEDAHRDPDANAGGDPDEDELDIDEDDVDHDDTVTDGEPDEDAKLDAELDAELAADLVPLLPAARAARDELVDEGRPVSRDALARRMRRNGHSIRNNRVSELLAALRREARSVNGRRPTAAV